MEYIMYMCNMHMYLLISGNAGSQSMYTFNFSSFPLGSFPKLVYPFRKGPCYAVAWRTKAWRFLCHHLSTTLPTVCPLLKQWGGKGAVPHLLSAVVSQRHGSERSLCHFGQTQGDRRSWRMTQPLRLRVPELHSPHQWAWHWGRHKHNHGVDISSSRDARSQSLRRKENQGKHVKWKQGLYC